MAMALQTPPLGATLEAVTEGSPLWVGQALLTTSCRRQAQPGLFQKGVTVDVIH